MRRCLILILSLAMLLSGCCTPVTEPALPVSEESSEAESSASASAEPEASIPEEQPEEEVISTLPDPYRYTLCFAGDVSLANGGSTVDALNSLGLEGCISETLLNTMRSADVMCLNSEFVFSDGGSPLEGKTFTFRSTPSRISVLQEMGVDVAVLANNHVFDYGEQGLMDTLDTFHKAKLPCIGAGRNLEEASAIWYAELDDCTVAYIAGSRVEWEMLTRGATENAAGVFRTAESNQLMLQRIAEAREKADFVVVYQHWGQEGTTELEDYQLEAGKAFLDAGADVVVGDHPHVVQGIEWYHGKPIFYSMGNYWFTSQKERYTMLLNMIVQRDEAGTVSTAYQIVPAWTTSTATTYLNDAGDRSEFYRYLESISVNASIEEDGTVLEAY